MAKRVRLFGALSPLVLLAACDGTVPKTASPNSASAGAAPEEAIAEESGALPVEEETATTTSPDAGVVFDVTSGAVINASEESAAVAPPPAAEGTGDLAAETSFTPEELATLARVEATYAPYEIGSDKAAGTFVPFSVFEPDERSVVIDTTDLPYRAIVNIVYADPVSGVPKGCTGGMVAADTALTAAHCVFSKGKWHADMTIMPGRNGGSKPFGQCKPSKIFAPEGWVNGSSDSAYDYAAIRLDCKIGEQTGWFGIAPTPPAPVNLVSSISGYPCDKPPVGRQWKSVDKVSATREFKIFYRNDTWGCMSGSPVFLGNDQRTIYAIHTNGASGAAPPWSENNAATRLTAERIASLRAFVGE